MKPPERAIGKKKGTRKSEKKQYGRSKRWAFHNQPPSREEAAKVRQHFSRWKLRKVAAGPESEDVQTIAILREDRDALEQHVEELEACITPQEREHLEAPIETD